MQGFFTISSDSCGGETPNPSSGIEARLHFNRGRSGNVEIVVRNTYNSNSDRNGEVASSAGFIVDPQQLAELGALFLALAGDDVDFESAKELLERYGLSAAGEKAITELKKEFLIVHKLA